VCSCGARILCPTLVGSAPAPAAGPSRPAGVERTGHLVADQPSFPHTLTAVTARGQPRTESILPPIRRSSRVGGPHSHAKLVDRPQRQSRPPSLVVQHVPPLLTTLHVLHQARPGAQKSRRLIVSLLGRPELRPCLGPRRPRRRNIIPAPDRTSPVECTVAATFLRFRGGNTIAARWSDAPGPLTPAVAVPTSPPFPDVDDPVAPSKKYTTESAPPARTVRPGTAARQAEPRWRTLESAATPRTLACMPFLGACKHDAPLGHIATPNAFRARHSSACGKAHIVTDYLQETYRLQLRGGRGPSSTTVLEDSAP